MFMHVATKSDNRAELQLSIVTLSEDKLAVGRIRPSLQPMCCDVHGPSLEKPPPRQFVLCLVANRIFYSKGLLPPSCLKIYFWEANLHHMIQARVQLFILVDA